MSDDDTRQVVYKFDDVSSSEGSYTNSEKGKRTKLCYGLLFLIVIAALATITAGVVLLRSARENKVLIKYQESEGRLENGTSSATNETLTAPYYMRRIKDLDEYCKPSDEAQRIGLNAFLEKCQQLYFEIYPHEELIANKNQPQHILNKIARRFRPFIPTPENLKKYTDKIQDLLHEINSIELDEEKLKPKENQIIDEIKVFLSQTMSIDFESGFYDGGWMFGPDYFCYDRICHLQKEIQVLTYYFRPTNVQDIEILLNVFLHYNETFNQYIVNLKHGIKSGMIKSKSACEAGEKAYKDANQDLFKLNILPTYTANIRVKKFYSHLEPGTRERWQYEYGQSILKALYTTLKMSFTIPVRRYHNFLANEYARHCPPDHVVSGLANLPVRFQYLDGVPDFSKPTTMKTPLTNTSLDGKRLYSKVLKRYTTLNVTADEVYEEGVRQLKLFYPKIVEIAQNYTNTADENEAINKTKRRLNAPNQYHGASKFPEIESNATAYARCVDEESAKKYCPVRWRSMEKWRNYLYRIMAMIHPLLYDVFHFTGDKVSVPNCPIEIRPHFNPAFTNLFYESSDAECSVPTVFALPFFWEKYGPKFQEWSITGHEARPGHNFQHQGTTELFASPCENEIQSFFHNKGYFSGYIEGWALYAENPVLSDDVMLYENNMLQKLGMYKWQAWRAIRLVIDTGLHYRDGNNKDWALELLKKYALDDGTDFSRKEVVRYMSEPGQAASYMLGRLEFMKARQKVEEVLQEHFDIKDFHYQVLSLGPVPLNYLSKYIERYLNCLREPKRTFCEYILTPLRSIPKGSYRKKLKPPRIHSPSTNQFQKQRYYL